MALLMPRAKRQASSQSGTSQTPSIWGDKTGFRIIRIAVDPTREKTFKTRKNCVIQVWSLVCRVKLQTKNVRHRRTWLTRWHGRRRQGCTGKAALRKSRQRAGGLTDGSRRAEITRSLVARPASSITDRMAAEGRGFPPLWTDHCW
jgi:hypothetical protein